MSDLHLSDMIAALLAILLLVIAPTYLLMNKQEVMLQNYVTHETNLFISEVKASGKVSRAAYKSFIDKLDQTGYLYEISIEHQKKLVLPDYSDDGIFLNSYSIHYENTYEDDIVDEIYNGTGEYKMSFGDYITINIKSRNNTVSSNFINFLIGRRLPSDRIQCVDGGMVWNEAF